MESLYIKEHLFIMENFCFIESLYIKEHLLIMENFCVS